MIQTSETASDNTAVSCFSPKVNDNILNVEVIVSPRATNYWQDYWKER